MDLALKGRPLAGDMRLRAVVYCALSFGTVAFGVVEWWSLALFLAAASAAFPFWLPAEGGFPAPAPAHRTLLPAVLAVAAYGIVQRMTVVHPGGPVPNFPATVNPFETERAIAVWWGCAALTLAAPRAFGRAGDFRRFSWFLLGLGSFVAVVGIAQEAQKNAFIYGLRAVGRLDPFGPIYNRNHAAALMVMSSLAGWGLFTGYARRFWSDPDRGRRSDFASLGLMAAFFIGILAWGIHKTESRAAHYTYVLGVVVFVGMAGDALRSRVLRSVLRVCAAAVVAGLIVFVLVNPAWLGLADGRLDHSTTYRALMYRSGLELARDRWLFGVGLGGLGAAIAPYQDEAVRGFVRHIHSDWLEVAVEMGLPVAAVLVSGIYLGVRAAVNRRQSERSIQGRDGLAGAVAAMFSFLLHCLIDFPSRTPINLAVFVVLCAAAAGPSEILGAYAPKRGILRSVRFASWGLAALAPILLSRAAAAESIFLFARTKPHAERAVLLSWASRIYPHPRFSYSLGLRYITIAEKGPDRRREYFRMALENNSAALDASPLDPRYHRAGAYQLWRLGRREDSRVLSRLSNRLLGENIKR